jgi:hypothetical protein
MPVLRILDAYELIRLHLIVVSLTLDVDVELILRLVRKIENL